VILKNAPILDFHSVARKLKWILDKSWSVRSAQALCSACAQNGAVQAMHETMQ
jgi:hypothetical protein